MEPALMQNVFFRIKHALTQGKLTIAFLRGGCVGKCSEEIIFLSFMVYDFSLVSAIQDCFYQAGQQII